MTPRVIDASVAIKWVIDEAGSARAASLLTGSRLVAPDLLLVECANVLWKKVRRAELSAEEALVAIRLLQQADVELVPTRHLADQAVRLALELDHPVPDCLYLALALANDWILITADDRFVQRLLEPDSRNYGRLVNSLHP